MASIRATDIAKTFLALAPAVGVVSPVTSAWGMNISKLLATPDQTLGLFDTGGTNPNPAIRLDFKTFQVQVRGGPNDNAIAYQKAQDVKDRLLGIDSQDVLGDRMISLTMIGDITFAGRDENDRPIYSLNFRMIIEPVASTLTHREAV